MTGPDDALSLLRECQDRVLEREGIPMLLALVDEVEEVDEVDAVDEVPAAASGDDGERLAGSMERLSQELAPSGRDGDLGRVAAVLQAVAYRDAGHGRTLL